MSFSQRQGIEAAKTLQFNSMDSDLRYSLWNVFHLHVADPIRREQHHSRYLSNSAFCVLFRLLWIQFFKLPLTSMHDLTEPNLETVQRWFFDEKNTPWNHVYDFIEFVPSKLDKPKEFRHACNHIMEREASAYRFVGDIIAPLTSEPEVQAIEQVAALPGPLAMVGTHIKDALKHLSSRTEPNYRNSMKESISAVESVVKVILGQKGGTLGQLLDEIGPQLALHPSLVTAFKALYGYTSDADGIRHAMKDERTPEQEDARYFLVTCSAFTHYLIEKARKLNIL